ncbi:hypothetical protein BDN72DRAFT_769572 [Pluteus cervinus]|uniref:Uncharacterized protein n=1 Tax=Pluteus cervinus TaxID=181527 RepID=A0ACD3AQL9_9AGAR|nr:hypothetical protein BDN72DRAFT_769572 [Pluteus cervinus]
MILSANIAQDGSLTFGNAVATGGAGAHGLADLSAPDPLFAQGAVKVSAAAKMLAAVNPGSNTVSLFSIDPNNPGKLTMVGFPISSEGEFPMSLAFDKEGKNLCVLNGGAVNGVACFDVDAQKGLTPKSNTLRSLGLNQTTPATGPAGTASHILFSEDGTKLHASVKGVPPQPGFIASFDVESDGSLSKDFTPSVPAQGGLLPFSMTVIPGKNAILATDAGIGFDIFDFSQGLQASSSVVPIDGQKATCWSSFSKKTGNFYLTDVGTSIVTEVNVDDSLKGSIVQQIPQGDGTGSIDNDIASIGNNDFLYVLLANATTVSVSSLDAPGKVTAVQTFKFDDAAKAAGITVNPANVQGMTTFINA